MEYNCILKEKVHVYFSSVSNITKNYKFHLLINKILVNVFKILHFETISGRLLPILLVAKFCLEFEQFLAVHRLELSFALYKQLD